MDLKQKNLLYISIFILVIFTAFYFELKPRTLPKEKTIEFWQYWSGREKEALEALVKYFNKVEAKNYGFKVKMLDISMPQKKIMMAMAGGVAPDLVHLDGGMVVDFGLRGALEDLSVIARSAKRDVAIHRFIPIYIEALKLKDKQYAMPLMPTCEAMHINEGLLSELGFKKPNSLADFVLGSRIKDQGTLEPRASNLEPKFWMPSWPPWAGKFLPIVFGGNWGEQLANGSWQITANSPENIEAWTWVQENFAAKLKPGELESFTEGFSSYQSPDNPFYAGKVIIENSGVWEHNLAKIYSPNMEVAIAPFPGKMEKATLINVDALAIPKKAKYKKEAFQFMQWLLKQENLESLALSQGKFSPLKQVSENFYLEHRNPYIKIFIDLANSPNAKFFPQVPYAKRYEREIKEAYDKVLQGKLSAKDALDDLQKSLEQYN